MLIHCLSNCTRLARQRFITQTPSNRINLLVRNPTNSQHSLNLRHNFHHSTKSYNSKGSTKQHILYTPTLRHQLLIHLRRNTTNVAEETKTKLRRGDVMRLVRLAKSEKLTLTAAVLCLVVSSAITMSVPYALGKILDIIFQKEGSTEITMNKLKEFTLFLIGVFLIGGLANYGRVYLFNSASIRIVKDLRTKVYRRMLNQETSWFDTKGSGELISRLSNDTYFIGNTLSQNLSDGMRSLVMVGAGTGMMIYTSPELSLISTVVVPFIAGIAVVYGRYVRSITRKLLDKFAEIMKNAEERLGNVKTVKSFCKEDYESKSFDKLLIENLELAYKEVRARALFFGASGLSGNAIIVSVLYYGGSLVITDALTIGALTSFILYAGYSAISINGLSNFYTEINKGIGSAHRIWEILDRQYAIPIDKGIVPLEPPKCELVFENINFCFPMRPESFILKNFNLTLEPGKNTAIVGRSGTGKTTIATLVLRLYDPSQGRLLLDGTDLKSINPKWLRSHIGTVHQEPVLFSGTIRENILYGLNDDATISEDEFQAVVRKSYVDEFTAKLPDGLETLVGQRGVLLSGGQKQRVAIARALIRNPCLLILDEATSALDSVSEELVQNALTELAKGRTVLTIAHRLSTIRNADKIVVIDQGTVHEEGSYESLISSDAGVFRELVKKQTFLKGLGAPLLH